MHWLQSHDILPCVNAGPGLTTWPRNLDVGSIAPLRSSKSGTKSKTLPHSMSTETSVATVALIVSLIALFIAVGQLLQQIFGTAEGYRRCQYSIVGPWSELRHRRIRWAELRMETQFKTPSLTVVAHPDLGVAKYHYHRFDTADRLIPSRENIHPGQVGWLGLLSSLQYLEQNYKSYSIPGRQNSFEAASEPWRTHPVFIPRLQSWDLMPPDVVRPLATTTLGDILVIAHRLGLDWTTVRPNEGLLHAHGHGQSLTSIEIRSFGLALRYTNKDPQRESAEDIFLPTGEKFGDSRSLSRLFVPTTEVDKMAFGFIPENTELGTGEHCLTEGTRKFDGLQETLMALNVKWKAVEYCTKGLAGQNFYSDDFRIPQWNGVADAIYLLSPWLPVRGTGATRVRLPHRSELHTPLNWREGHVVFWLRLREEIATLAPTPLQMQRVLGHLDQLATNYPDNFIHIQNLPHRWKSHHDSAITTLEGLEFLKLIYEDAIAFLQTRSFDFTSLVASHIEMAVEANQKALATPEAQRRRCDQLSQPNYTWMVEQAHLYVDNLELVQKAMQKRHPGADPDDIRDAWWTMILKGIAWKFSVQPHGSHSWHPYKPIASHFWRSDLPIYIF